MLTVHFKWSTSAPSRDCTRGVLHLEEERVDSVVEQHVAHAKRADDLVDEMHHCAHERIGLRVRRVCPGVALQRRGGGRRRAQVGKGRAEVDLGGRIGQTDVAEAIAHNQGEIAGGRAGPVAASGGAQRWQPGLQPLACPAVTGHWEVVVKRQDDLRGVCVLGRKRLRDLKLHVLRHAIEREESALRARVEVAEFGLELPGPLETPPESQLRGVA